ncbi:PEP-CTERM sorting domain-containing protein [bacterium]|nr:PEP-CTERM sorting domain-containing protein [bacterium]
MSFIFRDLPAYSLIGVWSTEQSLISPVDGGPNPAFFIGSAASLTAPDAASFIYLFLANNDGLFTDNGAGYNVVIETTTAPVPEPSTIVLTLAGLMGITCFRSRKQEIRN